MVLTTRFKLLCAVAAAVIVYGFATSPDTPAPVEASAGSRAGARSMNGPKRALADTGTSLTRLARRVSDRKAASALFGAQSWYVAPAAPPAPPSEAVAVVEKPAAPSAPPLPFTVMGSYARAGDGPVYFLTRGDRVFDVHVGDTIDNTYSVDGVADGQLQLTYKPLKIQQSLAIGDSK